MPGGTLPEYIKNNPDADRLGLVGAPLMYPFYAHPRHQLSDVANGLCYLHSRNVVHGDLKGVRDCSESHPITVLTPDQANILVDADGHARIMNFSHATVAADVAEKGPSDQRIGSEQWSAPEVLDDGIISKKTDIFSFAMVMIEVRHGRSAVGGALADCCSSGVRRNNSIR